MKDFHIYDPTKTTNPLDPNPTNRFDFGVGNPYTTRPNKILRDAQVARERRLAQAGRRITDQVRVEKPKTLFQEMLLPFEAYGNTGVIGAPIRKRAMAIGGAIGGAIGSMIPRIEETMDPTDLEDLIAETRRKREMRSDFPELERQRQASKASQQQGSRVVVPSQAPVPSATSVSQAPVPSATFVSPARQVSIDLGRGKYEEAARALRLRDAAAFIAREAQRRGMENVPTEQGQREELLRADQERSAQIQAEAARTRMLNSLPPDVRLAAMIELEKQGSATLAQQALAEQRLSNARNISQLTPFKTEKMASETIVNLAKPGQQNRALDIEEFRSRAKAFVDSMNAETKRQVVEDNYELRMRRIELDKQVAEGLISYRDAKLIMDQEIANSVVAKNMAKTDRISQLTPLEAEGFRTRAIESRSEAAKKLNESPTYRIAKHNYNKANSVLNDPNARLTPEERLKAESDRQDAERIMQEEKDLFLGGQGNAPDGGMEGISDFMSLVE